MKKNIVDIESIVLNRFQKNLEVLQQHFPQIYEKVTLLNDMINDQSYPENFSLEYKEEQNEFDLILLKNNSSLYGHDPKQYNENILKTLDFDKKNTINTLAEHVYLQDNIDLNFNNFAEFEQVTYNEARDNIYPFIESFSKDIYNKENQLKHFHKFIFFGTLLGTHINEVYKKFKPNVTLIIEPNLEIFRLSLFTTDYFELIKSTQVVFSIMEDENSFNQTIDFFLHQMLFNNDYIKFYSTNINTEGYIKKTVANIARLNPMAHPYTRKLKLFERAINYKQKSFNFLDLNNIDNKHKDLPVLLLAAGPSLSENFIWLQKNQKKFILISPLSVVEILLKNNIFVDIAVIGDYSATQQAHFNTETKNYLKTITILSNASIDPEAIENIPKENLFFIESTTSFLRQQLIGCSTVGDMSLYLLLKLNFTKIYLLGLDLAYSIDNQGYVNNYTEGKEKYYTDNDSVGYTKSDNDSLEENYSTHKNTIRTKGNFREEVDSQAAWYHSLLTCNRFINSFKPVNTSIYNLSDGVYINETTPLKIKELDVSNYSSIDKTVLHTICKNNSYNHLLEDELLKLNQEIEFLTFSLDLLSKNFNKNFKTYNQWIEEKNKYYQLIILTKGVSFSAFTSIFYNYTYLMENYINGQFNIENNTIDTVEHLNQLWKETLAKYLNRYLNTLQDLKDKYE